MADMIRKPPMGGGGQFGGAGASRGIPGAAGGATQRMNNARSIMNPTDVAAMFQTGGIGGTLGEFIEKNLKVPLNTPAPQGLKMMGQSLQQQAQTASPMGKMQAMAKPQAQTMPRPSPRPQQAAGPPAGIDALMPNMGR